ncbi:UNVERIFIED_CONTAM: Mitochondrial substrate carrier family protein C [Sesamum radiatum]|uniref:Mitochondrial substrate carrier family protein C n=1 Tax=Sesamum radiatum TaxID=300843 RepID=A0AAW2JVF4_SESRA
MVVSGNDPLESFLNSIQVVKNAFSPLESNFRKVAKNFEHCFNGASKYANLNGSVTIVISEVVAAQLDLKKKSGQHVVSGNDRRKGKVPVNLSKKGLKERYGSDNGGKEDRNSYGNCLPFDLALSFLINGFVQAFPRPLKSVKKRVHKMSNEDTFVCDDSHMKVEVKPRTTGGIKKEQLKAREGKDLPFEYFIGFVVDHLNHLPKFDVGVQENECNNAECKPSTAPVNQFDHLKALFSILEGKRADVNGFLGNLKFARVGGVPSGIVEVPSVKDVGDEGISNAVNQEESGGNSPQKLGNGLLSIPLSNVERLRSTLSTVSLTELIELLPQIGRPSKEDHPDKKKLFSVQDFFRYTEAEGKRFFLELDRDGDGQVTLEDLEVAMRKRKLPKRYAHEFMRRTRSHLFSRSFGWKQFLSLMEQKEPTILRAYTSLCLSKSGTLQKSEILASLQNAGLPANEDNAVAMMRFLNADTEESISYGHFRNFMLLLPSDRLQEDPRSIWFEAATVVAVPPSVEIPTGSVLKSALAGGLSCALSTALLHPVDTVKTRVQASTLTFPEILSKLPQLGARGLYRGSIPAILGQFSSHGLRTGIFEASKLVLINVAPTLPELQILIVCIVFRFKLWHHSVARFSEQHYSWNLAARWSKRFFPWDWCHSLPEVPFYVAGMGLYAESKKAAQQFLGRELEPWEAISVGALSGGLAAVLTTPFDVMKTRMMTAPQGHQVTLSMVAFSILRREGPLGLFKGAVPRFFWIAPLGAMNFAGYELARKAMNKSEETAEPLVQK